MSEPQHPLDPIAVSDAVLAFIQRRLSEFDWPGLTPARLVPLLLDEYRRAMARPFRQMLSDGDLAELRTAAAAEGRRLVLDDAHPWFTAAEDQTARSLEEIAAEAYVAYLHEIGLGNELVDYLNTGTVGWDTFREALAGAVAHWRAVYAATPAEQAASAAPGKRGPGPETYFVTVLDRPAGTVRRAAGGWEAGELSGEPLDTYVTRAGAVAFLVRRALLAAPPAEPVPP